MNLFSQKKIIFFICLLSYSENSFSQVVNPTAEEIISSKNAHNRLMDELKGVYQIQMINTRAIPTIDTELLKTIKSKQKDNEQVIVTINDKIRIVILSKTEIKNGNLFTDDDHVIYMSK